MANRRFRQFRYSLEAQPVDLFFKVAIGATGAPTLSAVNSKGILSIARNSAGKYTITLQDKYNKILDMDCTEQNATGISASPNLGIVSTAVSSATPTVVIQFSTGGAATDIASGSTLYGRITLSNSDAV